jgi:predicted enzyme related to lactoylglutathione lyase
MRLRLDLRRVIVLFFPTMQTPRNPVGWFEIYVNDMARAKAFYESVFQTKLEHLPTPSMEGGDGGLEMWMFPGGGPEGYGCPGALCKMTGCEAGGSGTLIYFSCEDCAVEAGRVKESGGSVYKEKFAIGDYGFIAIACDTEGNTIGLHSMK